MQENHCFIDTSSFYFAGILISNFKFYCHIQLYRDMFKTYLPLCMDEARLSHFTFLCMEQDINIDKDKVLGRFAAINERRMHFFLGP